MGKKEPNAESREKVPLLRASPIQSWPQHLAGISAGLMTMSMGFVAGWSAFATPYLRGKVGKLPYKPVDTNQASWIASIVTLGALVGCLPSGLIAGKVGRKWYLTFLVLPLITGWCLIALSEGQVNLIYLGRFLCGFTFGGVTVTVPLYNNEIVEDRLRGKIGSYFDLMLSLGLFLVYVIGANTTYYVFSVICCTFPLVFVCLFVWMPESPYYLVSKGRIEDAKKAIRWLRRGISDGALDIEIDLIRCIVHESDSSGNGSNSLEYARQSFQKLRNWNITSKAIVMAIGMMSIQRLSGVSAIMYYTVDIFHDANTSISPENATILVGLLGVIGCLVSALLVDKIGRRFLLICSGFIMALGYALMAAYFIAVHYGKAVYLWLPVVVIPVMLAFFRLGLGPIPWFMLVELTPPDAKPWAQPIIVSYNWILTFIVVKEFPIMLEDLGYPTIFIILSAINAFGVFFSYFVVLETKNRSHHEIQSALEPGLPRKWSEVAENDM